MNFIKYRILKLLKEIIRRSLNNGINYSFLSSFFVYLFNKSKFSGQGNIIKSRYDIVKLHKNSTISLKDNLYLHNSATKNKKATCLELKEGSKLIINGRFTLFYGEDVVLFKNSQLLLDDGCVANSNLILRVHDKITIGKNCLIGHNVVIMDGDGHQIDNKNTTKPIKIGNHVWIASGATILKGVTIGDNSVIGAGAVVTHDVESNSLVVGNPAKVVRRNIKWKDQI